VKVAMSDEKLGAMWPWTPDLPRRLVRLIGALEVLGAIGLILPRLTGIAPGLSVAAAIRLALLPLGGLVLHLRRGESSQAVPNIVISALAAITAWLAAAPL
jgi:hypothetical protein